MEKLLSISNQIHNDFFVYIILLIINTIYTE